MNTTQLRSHMVEDHSDLAREFRMANGCPMAQADTGTLRDYHNSLGEHSHDERTV
jgi:hypothetical protein